MSTPRLYYFADREFHRDDVNWFSLIDVRHLVMIDVTRHEHRSPIYVSPDKGAVGRRLGDDGQSWHNVDRHGLVYACDYLPDKCDNKYRAMRFFDIAESIGWTGIGLYVGWPSGTRWHLDTRTDRMPGDPALWGAIWSNGRRHDVSLEEALEALPK